MLELAILGVLAEQPRHGYELKKRLSDTLGPLWGISFGSRQQQDRTQKPGRRPPR
jgi:DNA-binding PadR family transcriptional regulator